MASKKRRRRVPKALPPSYVNDLTASEILMIAAPTLRRWRQEGRGPKFCKLEGLVRYRISDLHEWAHQREVA